ncbi:MAG TPA: hypothetical protein VN281_14825 [Verrucomicrobiae bacterium]|jgi:hypothetical protein|nr:hypothetical protein [Verrucomicrobiae bacterium]
MMLNGNPADTTQVRASLERHQQVLILTRVKSMSKLPKDRARIVMSPKLSLAIIFSDSVIREHGTGKHTLIGTFQLFNAPAFPFVCPPFFVTALIENLSQGDLITAKAILENSEGAELGSVTGQLKLETMFDEKGQTELPFPFRPISFESPGEYAVRILVNEQEIGRRSLLVRSLPQLLGSSV